MTSFLIPGRSWAMAAAFSVLTCVDASAQTMASTAPAPAPAPLTASMSSTRQIDFESKINGESYQVKIFIPRMAPPQGRYASIYVLDGNALFGTFAEAVRNRSQASEIEPVVVVGIASGEGAHGADRTFDFTSTDLTAKEKGIIKDLGPNPRFGGADRFLRVIEEEIKPKVEAIANVDPSRTTLFGWSLGGLFVIGTMFEHPDDFNTYLALSPSLWRGERVDFRQIPAFEQRLEELRLKPRFFVGVGSREEESPEGFMAGMMTHDELVAELQYCRMVGNAVDMSKVLGEYFERNQLPFASRVFDGETHNSVPWAAVNAVLNFSFSRVPDGARN